MALSPQTEEVKRKAYFPDAIDSSVSPPLNSSIQVEDEELILRLQEIFKDKEQYRKLVDYQGQYVQQMLDSLQQLLDTTGLDSGFKRGLIVATQRLCKRSGLYPACYKLKDITIQGNYPIDAGGFAEIFKGDFKGQTVCIKAVKVYQNREVEYFLKVRAKQFSKEAVLWSQLSHPNLLPIYGLFRFRDRPCLVSPWMSGGHINEYLLNNPQAARLPLACTIMMDVARGLSYLHENKIIHGDLKGPNILVNELGIAHVADFGLSSVSDLAVLSLTSHSSANSMGGTLRWQAPELFDMESGSTLKNTTASDVYAWSLVCYEAFTGNKPFSHIKWDSIVLEKVRSGVRPTRPDDSSPPFCDRGLNKTIWSIMEDCWAQSPDKRPTITRVIELLQPQIPKDDRLNKQNGSGNLSELSKSPMRFRKTMGSQLDMITVADLENLLNPAPSLPAKSTATDLTGIDEHFNRMQTQDSKADCTTEQLSQSDNRHLTPYILKELDTASIRRAASDTPWPKSLAKLFRGAKNSGSSTITADIKETDTVIAIVGSSGPEGKHEFASTLTDYCPHYEDSVEVQHVVIKHPRDPSRNTILVYTTGNDKKLSDALHSISIWLAESSSDNKKVSGMVYLEPITSTSPKRARTVLDVINKYVEKSNIVIATTGWGDISPDTSEQREKEARDRWRALVGRGVSLLKLCPPGVVRDADADAASSLDIGFTPRDVLNLLLSQVVEKRSGSRRRWKKEKRADGIFMDDPRPADIVIPIMGPTGVGKSTFINTVAGKMVTKVGHSLIPETTQLHPVILSHPKEPHRRIILLDTPGFNDMYVSESEILRRIAVWLARSYSPNMKLTGAVYFHEFSQTRMLGTFRRDLDMFSKLCGAEAMKNVILATTKWGDVPESVRAQREQELQETHWREMMELGSDVKQFEATFESGWKILNRILEDDSSSGNVDAVEIQNELAEIKKILPDTEAGRTLLYSLKELLNIQRSLGEEVCGEDSNSDVKQRIRESDEKVQKQIKELSVPLHYHVLGWMKKLKSRVENDTTEGP